MSRIPETRIEVLSEKEKWENIISSPDWIAFKKYLEGHCAFLQKEVNDNLRGMKNLEAYGALRALDDSKKMLESVRIRLSELNKAAEKGG